MFEICSVAFLYRLGLYHENSGKIGQQRIKSNTYISKLHVIFRFLNKKKICFDFSAIIFLWNKTLFCHFDEGFSPFADFCTRTYILHMSYSSIQDTTIFVTKSERMTFGCLELCIRVIVPAYESQQIYPFRSTFSTARMKILQFAFLLKYFGIRGARGSHSRFFIWYTKASIK